MQLSPLSRRVLRGALLVVGLLVWHRPEGTAAAPLGSPGTRLYAFGLHLFRLQEYYRAITELRRFTLLFPQHHRHTAAQLLIGLALQEEGLYDDAFGYFQRLGQRHDGTDVGRLAAFKLGELRFVQQHYRQASAQFQHFLHTFPRGPLVWRSKYFLSLSWILDHQFARARRLLATFPPQHPLAAHIRTLQVALRTAPPETIKSPRTAGILAGILPGAGHLYLGKPLRALSAFLLNGLFLTGAALAFREGLEASGAILLYFETGWYLGNIKSAVDDARIMNRNQRRTFANHLRATYALPPLTLQRLQMPGLGLRLPF